LRVVGTHNYKYGEPREVRVLQHGERLDLVEIEEFLDAHTTPLFDIKEEYRKDDIQGALTLDIYVPVDADAFLSDTPTTGEAINALSYRVLRALIVREGFTPQESLDAVVEAVMKMAAVHYPDWTAEEEVRRMTPRMTWVLRCLQDKHWEAVETGHINSAEPPDWLPPEWRDSWITACQHNAKPVVHRNAHGYRIRAIAGGKKTREKKNRQ
jgi:hypothetical protein